VRRPLIAYNMIVNCDCTQAQTIARSIRSDAIRALALQVSGGIQISTNLVRPERVTLWDVVQLVESMTEVLSTELVGLIPRTVLEKIPRTKWEMLDLDASRTIEARYEALIRAR
jgi:glutamate formiminotransferase